MKVPILFAYVLGFLPVLHGAPLSDADRESLLESLERMRAEAEAGSDAKMGVALAAYRSAIASDQAAVDLYLDCLEKVNFVDQDKSGLDFVKWKRNEGDRLSEPNLKQALRHQLRWLILTIRASSDKADRDELATEAQDIVDSIFREPAKIQGQEGVLGQAVTSSVFAAAYKIDQLKVEKWPLSPTELNTIYDELLLPQWRSPERLAELRSTWIKRIVQEGFKVEFFPARPAKGKDQRAEPRDENHARQIEDFETKTRPKLQWNMEMDLFAHGDEKGAALRMFTHLQKYSTHPSAEEWANQLKTRLAPASKVGADETKEANP
jgi:hypothetical protein